MDRNLIDWTIRDGTPDLFRALLDLWVASETQPTVTDSVSSLHRLVAADPQALLVAEANGMVTGSLIAAWNGWRGSFYRLAVHPDYRRCGVGTSLVHYGEKRLLGRGAVRIDAIVTADDPSAVGFWRTVGYERQQGQSRFVRNLRAS